MSFHDEVFPEGMDYGYSGGPAFAVDVVRTPSGKEVRNIRRSNALREFTVSYSLQNGVEFNTLLDFFLSRQGKAHSFKLKDWSDYTATNQAQIVAAGESIFQLTKTYGEGSYQTTREISKPKDGTVEIRKNGLILEEGPDYTIDYLTGVVTLTQAAVSDDEFYADFQFYVPVRFDTNQMASKITGYEVNAWEQIPLIEVNE